jgi:hypothetical protein
MRFMNIAIPKGATITNAYIEFETDETAPQVIQTLPSMRKLLITRRHSRPVSGTTT